jgi:hypothetical protein
MRHIKGEHMEEYLKKRLIRIRHVLTLTEIANALDPNVSPQTILNWIETPGNIPTKYIDQIKAIHVKLRSRINKAEKEGIKV